MLHKMRYRLGIDLGSTSLGWAMIRLNEHGQPCAVIKAGVRIFSNGRNPRNHSSLAVARREARATRRRRDRFLKRRARMIRTLIEYGFFPTKESQRKILETMDPFAIRAKGLDRALTPAEFGRALFHINQRRGFKSNRKTDRKDKESGTLKTAIKKLRETLKQENCRTIGEFLNKRNLAGQTVRARYRKEKITKEDGKSKINKSYDFYIDRAMIEHEFDVLWAKQAELNPAHFTEAARKDLKDVLLHQRELLPVKPGRCTFLPDEERAPLALPSTQRFRMYQEVNNLRILREGLKEESLTLKQRDDLIAALEMNCKRSFIQIKRLLGVGAAIQFNFEGPKRKELKGNMTSAILSKEKHFGSVWFDFDEKKQDFIVQQLVNEESETKIVRWLQDKTGVDEERAVAIANVGLPKGYGSLCVLALGKILPELRRDVVSYDKAVKAAGFDHHSDISPTSTGEILSNLPYYGKPLQRHVGFGSNDPKDTDEKRYGRIANPTVHIGLNQVRLVVNTLLKRYGHPVEVIVEVLRELKQSEKQRKEEEKQQAKNKDRKDKFCKRIANILGISEEQVSYEDIIRMILWEELSSDPLNRRCPYSGVQISESELFSNKVEIEHILPFSQTLDDSLNNKTVALREANRIKGNQTPWDAFGAQMIPKFNYNEIVSRAEQMPKAKRYRFGKDGYQRWLKDNDGFLSRALNDSRYLSRVAREYMSLICPNTRVIPGELTAKLRGKFGLNYVLDREGKKNRNDHRHHAVDACVVAVTDQSLLQRFSKASASARKKQLSRLVEKMPLPWETYRNHVRRAIESIWVSHKPDHSYEGAMHDATAYGLRGDDKISYHKVVKGKRTHIEGNLKVIKLTSLKATSRHGVLPNGELKPYKGYKANSNYCIEIVQNKNGKWKGEVITTFDAYQYVHKYGEEQLRHPTLSVSKKPLVMRLMINDVVRLSIHKRVRTMRVVVIKTHGQITLADINEANVDKRNRVKKDIFSYVTKSAGGLQSAQARHITISPIGVLRDSNCKVYK